MTVARYRQRSKLAGYDTYELLVVVVQKIPAVQFAKDVEQLVKVSDPDHVHWVEAAIKRALDPWQDAHFLTTFSAAGPYRTSHTHTPEIFKPEVLAKLCEKVLESATLDWEFQWPDRLRSWRMICYSTRRRSTLPCHVE
mmetsp:Transcript_43968/g.102761  ORF Transcript_43968/g.102761 Transcript_43968/m.102761 type:complete len:139 (+) Transcript_43968:220-636(+)